MPWDFRFVSPANTPVPNHHLFGILEATLTSILHQTAVCPKVAIWLSKHLLAFLKICLILVAVPFSRPSFARFGSTFLKIQACDPRLLTQKPPTRLPAHSPPLFDLAHSWTVKPHFCSVKITPSRESSLQIKSPHHRCSCTCRETSLPP